MSKTVLTPSPGLLAKLASIVVHADEMAGEAGHEFDRAALVALLGDAEVREWIDGMTRISLAPRRRKP